LERYCIHTRLEEATRNLENWLLVMSKLVNCFDALRSLNLLVTFLNPVVTSKGSFFLSFNFDLDKCAEKLFKDFHVNFTVDSVSWLIEWVFSLYLNLSFREFTTSV